MNISTTHIRLSAVLKWTLCLSVISGLQAQAPFQRADYGPGTPGFRDRFLANYGVNSEIEPKMESQDRPLYESVAPLLTTNPQRAIRLIEDAQSKETNPAFAFLLGSLYYQIENFAQSEKNLLAAVDQFPEFRRAYRALGLIYVQDGRYEASIATWLKVITLGGGDAQSYGLLGYSYLAEQKYQSALSAYEMASMFNPESKDFRRGLAQCLLETGQSLRAVALFEELIESEPLTADYWLLQANALLALERYEEATSNLEIADSLGAGNTSSRILLGNLYLQADNQALALKHYQRALQLDAGVDLTRALQPLEYLIARSLFDEAESLIESIEVKIAPDTNPQVIDQIKLTRANIAIGHGDYKEAFDLLEPVVKANPLNADALIQIAEVARQTEDYAACELYLERAQSIPGKEAEALVALGRMEVSRGNLQQAIQYLRSAQDIQPNSQIARYISSIEKAL